MPGSLCTVTHLCKGNILFLKQDFCVLQDYKSSPQPSAGFQHNGVAKIISASEEQPDYKIQLLFDCIHKPISSRMYLKWFILIF